MTASGPRVTPRLSSALNGVVKLAWAQQFTLRSMLFLAVMIGVLGLMGFLTKPGGVINWIEQVILMTIIPILAFEAGAKAVREDLKPGAVDYLITRPLPRWAYVVFKYVAQWSITLFNTLLALGVMIVIANGMGADVSGMGVWIVGLIGGVSAFMALGFMMGAVTSRYLILGLFYAGLIEGAVGNIPIQLNKLSMLRHLRELLWGGGETWIGVSAGWLVLIAVVLLAVAAAIFSTKEFIGEKGGDS
jgi:ABC-2 type transport system permease protein